MIRQYQAIRGTIALAAALMASLAPAAWADPAPLAKPEAAIAANSQSSAAVRPNPDEQTASNAPAITEASCGDVCSGHGYGALNVSTRTVPSVRTPAAGSSSGFDWGDAGIGAGGAMVLVLIGSGGVLATSSRRGRRTHQRQTSPSS
jgi:hypothetical protein